MAHLFWGKLIQATVYSREKTIQYNIYSGENLPKPAFIQGKIFAIQHFFWRNYSIQHLFRGKLSENPLFQTTRNNPAFFNNAPIKNVCYKTLMFKHN
jgi:hypothetical protein